MSVSRSSIWFAFGTFFSRISGLLRDSVVAGVFGASIYLDAFLVAFRLPNLFRDMLAEGALSGAFTKGYAGASQESLAQATKLLGDTLRLVFLVGLLVCSLGVFFAPLLVESVTIFSANQTDQDILRDVATALTQLLFPYLLMPMLGSVLMGVLHQHGRFFISALSPIGLNVGFIVGATVFAQGFQEGFGDGIAGWVGHPGMSGLAFGVLFGGLLQLTAQYWGARKYVREALVAPTKVLPLSPELRNVMAIMLPAIIAASAGPVNVLINTNFATSLGAGAVTWLNYAFRLLQLPIGIFGVAVASAALPALSRSVIRAGKRVDDIVSAELQHALELVAWFMMTSLVFIGFNSESLIVLIFRHWNFTANDAVQTGYALQAYSLGIFGYGLIKVLTSFYYAVERTGYAMRVSLFSIVVTLVGNALLVEKFGHVGLALTSSASLTLNAGILIWGLRASRVRWDSSRLLKSLIFIFVATALSLLLQSLCVQALSDLDWALSIHAKWRAGLVVLLNGLVVVAVFGGVGLWYLRLTPSQAWARFRKR